MTLKELQNTVDSWITKYGVRYFDILTNNALLMEEVGELSRIIARIYGEQSFKNGDITPDDAKRNLEEELGDILFVLTCIANQTEIDLSECVEKNLSKKTHRDRKRHLNNPKLTD